MKISDIIKTGATMAAPFFPALAAVIPVVNALLPDDKQLPETSTGIEIHAAIKTLPPVQQEMILSAEIDLEKTKVIEHTKVIDALAKVDSTGNSTRPEIAKNFSAVVCFNALLTVSMWAYAVIVGDQELLKTIQDSWEMLLALNAPFLIVIRSYFGMRTDEKNTRQHTANGMNAPMKGIANLISAIRK